MKKARLLLRPKPLEVSQKDVHEEDRLILWLPQLDALKQISMKKAKLLMWPYLLEAIIMDAHKESKVTSVPTLIGIL